MEMPWQNLTTTLIHLHWLLVKYRIKYKILLLTYKSLHGLVPQYLSDLLHLHTTSRTLRSTDSGLLSIPHPRLHTFGDRAFSVAAPAHWNSLPPDIRNALSLDIYKTTLKSVQAGFQTGIQVTVKRTAVTSRSVCPKNQPLSLRRSPEGAPPSSPLH
ncbi:hypothetical protein N1851_013028 [Merluccius polli]|uniref:Uncharacterized protein n=1 Tax=Merluccius polli TaxID=89951 RepID=A0AA47MWL8_MERPO|nr:hypothetical protein N1851_013028 [Merluccius polli]